MWQPLHIRDRSSARTNDLVAGRSLLIRLAACGATSVRPRDRRCDCREPTRRTRWRLVPAARQANTSLRLLQTISTRLNSHCEVEFKQPPCAIRCSVPEVFGNRHKLQEGMPARYLWWLQGGCDTVYSDFNVTGIGSWLEFMWLQTHVITPRGGFPRARYRPQHCGASIAPSRFDGEASLRRSPVMG
jgi:hypothetical protein